MQPAVKAWADVVNASGGIGGRPIRVKVGDDANDPEKHLRLVREMVEQERVVAFAGMPAVDTQGASVKYLESKGIPVVGGVIGNQVWGTSPILFPYGIAGTQRARMLMRAAATSGKTRYAFVSISATTLESVLRSLRAGPAKEAGIEIVFDAVIEAGAPDYANVCSAAAGARVELMTIEADLTTQAQVVESCARQGFRPVYVTTGTSTDQKLLELAGKQLEVAIGISRTVPWMADRPADLNTYRRAMKAAGLGVNAETLAGWVSGRILERALRRIKGEITPMTVAQALRGLGGQDFDELVAPLGFSALPTEPNPGSRCFWPLIARNGVWAPARGGRLCLPH